MDNSNQYYETLKTDIMRCMDNMAALPPIPTNNDFKEIGSIINRHQFPVLVGRAYTLAALYTDVVGMWCVLVDKHPQRKKDATKGINEALENALTILTDWQ